MDRLCRHRRAPHLFPLSRRQALAHRARRGRRSAGRGRLPPGRRMDLVRRGRCANGARALSAVRLSGARGEPEVGQARSFTPPARFVFDARPRRYRSARGLARSMAEPDVATEPRRRSVQCASAAGLHRISYLEWGDPRNRDALICVHGLTRSARDFDELARALSGQFRVVCPDLAGRGDSDRLADAKLYVVPQYVADMVTLIARLDAESVNWVGTSLGGLVGMALAAQPGAPVKKLVLNDVGPLVSKVALARIGGNVGKSPTFASLDEAEKYLRTIAAPFGPHSETQWRFLTETWVRKQPDGNWRAHYDPRIAEAYNAQPLEKDLDLWPLYDAVRCPTLVVRGEHSDLLSRDTAVAMTRRGPKAKLAEIRGVGHAPTLLHADQIAIVRDFLLLEVS